MAIKLDILDRDNSFYRASYQKVVTATLLAIVILIAMLFVVIYQVYTRPLPHFNAISVEGKQIALMPNIEPNLTAPTILKWASKAAVAAYTFAFVNYDKQFALARQYFTDAGWADYQNSVAGLISTIKQNQLFVNSVVSGDPVISNQGILPNGKYGWRVQIPFLVTYQSAEVASKKNFTVIITIVKVPTSENPKGIGIDQFVMS